MAREPIGVAKPPRRPRARRPRADEAVSGPRVWEDFRPADPRTQISTLTCFGWLRERGRLEGTDYFEFGIFRGFNLWFVQAFARAMAVMDMRFVGFDSFSGLPRLEGIDCGGSFARGDFRASRPEVEAYFTHFGVDWNTTVLVEGLYRTTLNAATSERYALRRCALCVVDCDLYASTVPVLSFVRPLLATESVIFFDDWEDFEGGAARGEPRAFAEFMPDHAAEFSAEAFVDLPPLGGKGKAFVLRRKR